MLETLNLSSNPSWFKKEENVSLLWQCMSKQNDLKTLKYSDTTLNSEEISKVRDSQKACSEGTLLNLSTKDLGYDNAMLQEDENVDILCQFISRQSNLEGLDF